jgi:6-phosphogluconate dehydrogenase
MTVGFVGLGKMGSQIVSKLVAAGHEVIAYDIDDSAVNAAAQAGAKAAQSPEDLVEQLDKETPIIWVMIPAQFMEGEVERYIELLPRGSTLIDGGNSYYEDSMRRAGLCAKQGIVYLDVGTSGGVLGLKNGFSLMVGGHNMGFKLIEPLLKALSQPSGAYTYAGPSGYGHFTKMVHNGIEYAVMQAYAEGYDLLKYGPLRDINLGAIADVWQHGSIIQSTLNGLIADILKQNPELEGISGSVASSGEGEWAKQTADKASVGMPALGAALEVREASQLGDVYFATKLLAALRNAFGGHDINIR